MFVVVEESHALKTGDRVVAVKDHFLCPTKHKHGKILGFSGSSIGVEFDDFINGHGCAGVVDGISGKDGYCVWCDESELKLEEKELFKVGEKLEITGGIWFSKGDIVTITDVDEGDRFRTYRCTNGNDTWWVENESVKPVQSAVKGFKVGDRIEMVNNHDNAKIGMKGTIISKETYLTFGVCFDDKDTIGFHDCSGKCENGRGHYVSAESMKLISKFSVGQVYKAGYFVSSLYNGIIKITEVNGNRAKYKVLKGNSEFCPEGFSFGSIFAKGLVLLTGAEIGEALKDEPTAVKEVKRRAKVGEYIKMLNPDYNKMKKRYVTGDVLKVTLDSGFYPTAKDSKGNLITVFEEDYVVLENYKASIPTKPSKHVWTPAEVEKAKALVLDAIQENYTPIQTQCYWQQ